MSTINDAHITKKGRTLIRRGSYYITHRDKDRKITAKYTVNKKHGNYWVEYPQKNKLLIGVCEKGRG